MSLKLYTSILYTFNEIITINNINNLTFTYSCILMKAFEAYTKREILTHFTIIF